MILHIKSFVFISNTSICGRYSNKTLNETLLGVSSPMLLFSVRHPLDHIGFLACQTYQKGRVPDPSVERF